MEIHREASNSVFFNTSRWDSLQPAVSGLSVISGIAAYWLGCPLMDGLLSVVVVATVAETGVTLFSLNSRT